MRINAVYCSVACGGAGSTASASGAWTPWWSACPMPALPPPSVRARIERRRPLRLYPTKGGARLVKWPHTGEALPEGHWLEPGGWDHEHCDGCDRHIEVAGTFWQTARGSCFWLCPYCHHRLRQLKGR
jgi:hypothetical protein